MVGQPIRANGWPWGQFVLQNSEKALLPWKMLEELLLDIENGLNLVL